jgi:hypothetical protein
MLSPRPLEAIVQVALAAAAPAERHHLAFLQTDQAPHQLTYTAEDTMKGRLKQQRPAGLRENTPLTLLQPDSRNTHRGGSGTSVAETIHLLLPYRAAERWPSAAARDPHPS